MRRILVVALVLAWVASTGVGPRKGGGRQPPGVGPLTLRQSEVVRLAGEGLTMAETAQALGIAYDTVRWHMKGARRRLGARDKTAAAVWLWRWEREAA